MIPSVAVIPSKYNCCYASRSVGGSCCKHRQHPPTILASAEVQNSKRESLLCNLMEIRVMSVRCFVYFRPMFSSKQMEPESLSRRTSTHPPVLAQHVASGTLALVRAHHVDTAEGTQQRILGALVDVCRRSRVKQVAGQTSNWENAVRNFPYLHRSSWSQAQSHHHMHTRSHR